LKFNRPIVAVVDFLIGLRMQFACSDLPLATLMFMNNSFPSYLKVRDEAELSCHSFQVIRSCARNYTFVSRGRNLWIL